MALNSSLYADVIQPAQNKDDFMQLKMALNFITFYDLLLIMNCNDNLWKHSFKEIFGSARNFETKLFQLMEFRNLIVHKRKTVVKDELLDYNQSIAEECKIAVNWFLEIQNKYESKMPGKLKAQSANEGK